MAKADDHFLVSQRSRKPMILGGHFEYLEGCGWICITMYTPLSVALRS